MSEQLKPGAFLVFDTVENRYVETEGFVLNRFGGLMALKNHPEYPAMVYICSDVAEPDRYQVERWTGLYDRDGKPVYEGDVICSSHGTIWSPIWKDCEFLFQYQRLKSLFMTLDSVKPFTLIGTIHDSPEALEAKARETAGE